MRYLVIMFSTLVIGAFGFFGLELMLAPAPVEAEYWVRELTVVKKEIARSLGNRPKLIIAAGSSVLFGIDAGALGEELNVRAVNFGLHGGLTLETLLSETASVVSRGDTLILPLEQRYFCITPLDNWQTRNMIAWQPDEWRRQSLRDRTVALTTLPPDFLWELASARWRQTRPSGIMRPRLAAMDDQAILAKFRSAPRPDGFRYSAYHLDNFGNMLGTEGYRGPLGEIRPASRDFKLCDESERLLGRFAVDMSARGVAIYFANMPYVRTNSVDWRRVDRASRDMTQALASIAPVLDSRRQLVLDERLFFNTDRHLNAEGRALRTWMLAAAIRRNQKLMQRLSAQSSGSPE